eukprot:365758-Chlamydomonas_euryale.AAC.14
MLQSLGPGDIHMQPLLEECSNSQALGAACRRGEYSSPSEGETRRISMQCEEYKGSWDINVLAGKYCPASIFAWDLCMPPCLIR